MQSNSQTNAEHEEFISIPIRPLDVCQLIHFHEEVLREKPDHNISDLCCSSVQSSEKEDAS